MKYSIVREKIADLLYKLFVVQMPPNISTALKIYVDVASIVMQQ